MSKHTKEDSTVTITAEGRDSVTVSGNLFSQLADSFKQPTKPCRQCGSLKFQRTAHGIWLCAQCDQFASWRKGDEMRPTR